jgi:hypothetical protein
VANSIEDIMYIDGLNKYQDEIGVLKKGDYLRDNFSQALIEFLDKEKNAAVQFINGATSSTQLCQSFIDFLKKSKAKYSFDDVLKSLFHPDSEIEKAIKHMLPKLYRGEMNIFGFGLGSGYYEKDFTNYLRVENYSNKISIFGYDPHSKQKDDAITYLTPGDLNKTVPRFDIFISRWVLHHVKQNERWNTLVKFMNHMGSNGHIFIVEEGPYLLEKPVANERLYLLVQSLGDTFVNYTVFPEWLISGNFHIEHLRKSDFTTIEKSLAFKSRREKISLDVGIPTQTLIHYSIL